MKKFFILTFLCFLYLSCEGTPDVIDDLQGLMETVEIPDFLQETEAVFEEHTEVIVQMEAAEETEIPEEAEKSPEEILEPALIAEEIIIQEIEEPFIEEIVFEQEILEDAVFETEPEIVPQSFEEAIAADEETVSEEIVVIEIEDIPIAAAPAVPLVQPPVQQPPVQQPPVQQPPAQQPPVQQPPVQQPPVQQPPVQQPPAQQPPVQQIPVQPPQSLAPAEERTSVPERTQAETQQAGEAPVVSYPFSPIQPEPARVVDPAADIVFSRIVHATVGQTIEIPFRGTGWVYLGELSAQRGIVYNSRRLDTEGMTFIFRAEEAGAFALKFFKQDFLRDFILNDHVQIFVSDVPGSASASWLTADRGRVVAEPRWPSAFEEEELLRSGSRASANTPPVNIPGTEPDTVFMPAITAPSQVTQPSSPVSSGTSSAAAAGTASSQGTQSSSPASSAAASSPGVSSSSQGTASGTSSSAAPSFSPPQTSPQATEDSIPVDMLLVRAREEFNAGNTAAAIAFLDQYKEYFPSGTDELYWLYGQFYEANSPSRNILLALEYYRRLLNEYPQSSRYNDARSRVTYLERFYINIR